MEIQYKVENDEVNDNLDASWINEFENTDKLYKDFYADDNYYSNIHFIYINKYNNIEKIKQEYFYMSKPNYISREEIIGLLKRNSITNNKRYTLLSILKININLKPNDIKEFVTKNDIHYYIENFLTPIKNIDAIIFDKTINMFQDLNDVFIIFYEKINTINSSAYGLTKKVYLKSNLNHNKTIRKTI